MSNTRGGMVVVGIDDKTGRLNPLSYKETQEVTALSGNSATDNVIPSILVDIENVPADGGVLVVATIKQGLNKEIIVDAHIPKPTFTLIPINDFRSE